jgi:hypothetical protein
MPPRGSPAPTTPRRWPDLLSVIERFRKAIFHRYDYCRGLTLWRKGQRNVEAWWCPSGYEIIPHSHPNETIELIPLFGWATFHRQKKVAGEWLPAESVVVTPRRWFRKHTVPMGCLHWFTVGRRMPLIFLNVSVWRDGVKPTTAAEDFEVME